MMAATLDCRVTSVPRASESGPRTFPGCCNSKPESGSLTLAVQSERVLVADVGSEGFADTDL